MKFHGIDAQGTLYDQRVSTLPTWSNADLGRIVFLTTNDTVYIASSTGWVPLSSVDALIAGDGISITKVSTPAQSVTIALADAFLSSGRTLWVYEDIAPTGWSIVSGCSDGLLAVKGGSSSYNVAGGTALQGSWTQTSHSHTVTIDNESTHRHTQPPHTHTVFAEALTVAQMPPHTHTYIRGSGYGGAGGGATPFYYSSGTFHTDSTGGGSAHSHGGVTGSGGNNYSNGTEAHTHTNTVSTVSPSVTYRPLANVGIIIKKD